MKEQYGRTINLSAEADFSATWLPKALEELSQDIKDRGLTNDKRKRFLTLSVETGDLVEAIDLARQYKLVLSLSKDYESDEWSIMDWTNKFEEQTTIWSQGA